MKYTLCLSLVLVLGLSGIARAETSVLEGPAGCTWNATVKKADKSSASVHVDEQYGSCVDEACPVDAEGKTYKLSGKKYKTGEVIKIWVDLDKKGKEHATAEVPKCWSQTVMLPTAPENIAPSTGPAAVKSPDASDITPVTSHISDSDPFDMPPVEAFPPPAVSKE
jgi:hypothetical protein